MGKLALLFANKRTNLSGFGRKISGPVGQFLKKKFGEMKFGIYK